jgi:TonB-dependent SusC/RagA subfamily outer membrane receptor
MKQKLKLLLLPYTLIAIGFIFIYCFLAWLLFLKLSIDDVNEELINFWLPFILVWVPILIWLRPGIKLLKLKRIGNRSPDFFYIMIAALSIAIPTIMGMNFLESAAGKLTALNDINDISNYMPTKFYTLKNFYVDKSSAGIQYSSDVSGRYNTELNLHIYIACPVYNKSNITEIEITKIKPRSDEDSGSLKNSLIIVDGKKITKQELYHIPPDSVENISVLKGKDAKAIYGEDAKNGVLLVTTKKHALIVDEEKAFEIPKAWLGIKYYKQISNNLSNDRKKELEHEFNNVSMQQFNDSALTTFTYLDRIGNNDERKGFRMAAEKKLLTKSNKNILIFEPKYKDFNSRNGNEFAWIFGAFVIGLCLWFTMIMIPKINAEKSIVPKKSTKKISIKNYLNFFTPKGNYYITPIIIDLNILIFLLMVISGLGFLSFDSINLLDWGGNYRPYTFGGEWWRLFTSLFIHAGFIHLFSNMFALFFIGLILEPVIGKKTFAYSYVVAGIIAGITSLWWHDHEVSVGASGAIFGLYGIFLVLLITKSVTKDLSKIFLTSTILFIGYNLVIGLEDGLVDNAAHIGGLLTGLLIGFFLARSINKSL